MDKRTTFPNMAGSQCNPEIIEKELQDAGIIVHKLPVLTRGDEVDCGLIGVVEPWGFRRAWYYWVANGDGFGIPPKEAMELHEKFGQEVRVNGNCLCPPPNKGFATSSYHVDTLEGLKALADLIKKLADKQ